MKMIIEIVCGMCKRDFKVHVKRVDYVNWKRGTFAQKAFPYLTADERELLISSTCGDCYDKLMKRG
jgi:hypothetical protein